MSNFEHNEKKDGKKSISTLVFQVISCACGVVGADIVISIFTGRLILPGSSDIISLEKTEAIIAAVITIGLAVSFGLLASRKSGASKSAQTENEEDNNGENIR